MVHIKSNSLTTEFNPSITQGAVANSSHRLQIVVSLSCTHTHTYTQSRGRFAACYIYLVPMHIYF